MVLSQRFVRGMIRYLPNYAFVLLVAAEPGEPPLGFGSIRMVSRPGSAPWAKFGFMVAESQQGKGIGTRIARGMYERAVELGVRTGGGTMLVDNGPSRALAERFGFPLTISTESDPRAPEGPVLRSVADLNEVLAHGPFPGSVPVPTGPGLPTELSSTAFDRPVQPPTTHEAPSE